MRLRNAFIHKMPREFLQPLRYFGGRRGHPFRLVILILLVFDFLSGSGTGFLRSCSPALSLSTDAGIVTELYILAVMMLELLMSSMKRKP